MRRQLAVAGAVDPAVAWDRYEWLETWSSWAPFISSVQASGERLAVGLTGVIRGPAGLQVIFAIDAVDPEARTWHWSVRSGPVALALGHEVLARSRGGCVATLELVGSAPVVLGYTVPATLALTRLVAP